MVVNVVNSAASAAAGAATATRSGLQKQVLALYRRALQAARRKDAELATSAQANAPLDTSATATHRNATEMFVRERFRDDVRAWSNTSGDFCGGIVTLGGSDGCPCWLCAAAVYNRRRLCGEWTSL